MLDTTQDQGVSPTFAQAFQTFAASDGGRSDRVITADGRKHDAAFHAWIREQHRRGRHVALCW
jgi:hypothetical protein